MQELNMKNSLDANMVQMSANYCLVYVAISAALFYRLSTHFLPMYIPYSVVEKNKQWMFKNICNSFVHSSISSIWIAFCLWNYPAHRYDFINVYSNQSYLLLCFSVGYFLYDLLDMYINDRDSSIHLLVHHIVVIGVFGVAIYSRYYLGYAMVGLLVEVNSVFLHMRTLMRLTGMAHSSKTSYRTVCWLNFGTFIVFRIYLLAYLTHWLLSHRQFLNPNLFLFTLPCLATINVMSWLLLAKITVEDFSTPLIAVSKWLGLGHLVERLEAEIALAEGAEGVCKSSEGYVKTEGATTQGATSDVCKASDGADNESYSRRMEGARMNVEGARDDVSQGATARCEGALSSSGGYGTDSALLGSEGAVLDGEKDKDCGRTLGSNEGKSEQNSVLKKGLDREIDLKEGQVSGRLGQTSTRVTEEATLNSEGAPSRVQGATTNFEGASCEGPKQGGVPPLFTLARRLTGLGSVEDRSKPVKDDKNGCEFHETESRGKVKAS